MRRCFGKPGMLDLGFHQLVILLAVVHPRPTTPVLAALLQPGVPHHPTSVSGLLRHPHLDLGQLDPKASTRLHNPQPHTGHRHAVATPRRHAMAGHPSTTRRANPRPKTGVCALRSPDQKGRRIVGLNIDNNGGPPNDQKGGMPTVWCRQRLHRVWE
jgi:hypothetical protein